MIDKASADDLKWLRGIQRNDEQALACLMRKYYADLYEYALKFTTNEEVVKNCIRNVFVTLWKERSVANQIHSIRLYFFKATRYKLLQCENIDHPQIDHVFKYNQNIYNSHHSFEFNEWDHKAIQNNLSKNELEVVYLRYYQHLGNWEIAELMNISQQTVYQLQLFAIEKLNTRLTQSQSLLMDK